MVHKAWKGMWKEWEFYSRPLVDNRNVQLYIGNCVDEHDVWMMRLCYLESSSNGNVIGILKVTYRDLIAK